MSETMKQWAKAYCVGLFLGVMSVYLHQYLVAESQVLTRPNRCQFESDSDEITFAEIAEPHEFFALTPPKHVPFSYSYTDGNEINNELIFLRDDITEIAWTVSGVTIRVTHAECVQWTQCVAAESAWEVDSYGVITDNFGEVISKGNNNGKD